MKWRERISIGFPSFTVSVHFFFTLLRHFYKKKSKQNKAEKYTLTYQYSVYGRMKLHSFTISYSIHNKETQQNKQKFKKIIKTVIKYSKFKSYSFVCQSGRKSAVTHLKMYIKLCKTKKKNMAIKSDKNNLQRIRFRGRIKTIIYIPR